MYAFIGLERVGGVIVYDVTEPAESFFETYINNRNFTAANGTTAQLDLGPEGLIFIDKDDSPTGKYMLVVANEVSGTTTLYNINQVGCSAAVNERQRGLVEGASETVHNTFSKLGSSSQNLRKLRPAKCFRPSQKPSAKPSQQPSAKPSQQPSAKPSMDVCRTFAGKRNEKACAEAGCFPEKVLNKCVNKCSDLITKDSCTFKLNKGRCNWISGQCRAKSA